MRLEPHPIYFVVLCDRFHQVDMQSFLSMTNTDLEEVGITDPEEKLNILDVIVEIKVSRVTSYPHLYIMVNSISITYVY